MTAGWGRHGRDLRERNLKGRGLILPRGHGSEEEGVE